jgi:hypothetical protein
LVVARSHFTVRETSTIYGHITPIPGETSTAEQMHLFKRIPEIEMCHVRLFNVNQAFNVTSELDTTHNPQLTCCIQFVDDC